MLGTSTISLSSPSSNPAILTVGGQTFTAAPSGFVVAGTAVVPGGPVVTISGTPVSLDPKGTLHVGSSAIPLATGGGVGVPFRGGQGRVRVPAVLGLLVGGFLGAVGMFMM